VSLFVFFFLKVFLKIKLNIEWSEDDDHRSKEEEEEEEDVEEASTQSKPQFQAKNWKWSFRYQSGEASSRWLKWSGLKEGGGRAGRLGSGLRWIEGPDLE
jgi:hypothetical protein